MKSKLQIEWRHRPVSSLASKNRFLLTVVKTYANGDSKVLWLCNIFLLSDKYFITDCLYLDGVHISITSKVLVTLFHSEYNLYI